jgi:hypothetical protein
MMGLYWAVAADRVCSPGSPGWRSAPVMKDMYEKTNYFHKEEINHKKMFKNKCTRMIQVVNKTTRIVLNANHMVQEMT